MKSVELPSAIEASFLQFNQHPQGFGHMATETPNASIHHVLDAVRNRLRRRNVFHWASTGLAVGCCMAALIAFASTTIPWLAMLGAVALTAGLGAIFGAMLPTSQIAAAGIVDSFYQSKDRAITALQFHDDPDPIRQMQVTEASGFLSNVDASECVDIKPNKPALYSSAAMVLVTSGVLMFALPGNADDIEAQPISLAIEQANELRESMLPELEQLKEESPEMEELAAKLEELVTELENESMDEADMMATLSEMEQALAEAHEAMKLEMTEAQMKGLASAMEPAESMQAAAAAMEEGDYDNASDKLEKFDPADLSDKERRAVSDNLKKFLAKLDPGQKGQLSKATQMLQEGLEKKNDSQCKNGACKLAKLCEKQGNCKKLGQCMSCQLNKLAQCKSQCRGGKNGCKGTAKSDSPSTKWGTGETNDPNGGDPTKLDSKRREEQLSGAQGDGPSESETIEAPEGEQDAVRQFAKRYQKFRSEAEAVLDSEPLPLGHRETVRQYFENIRPQNDAE